MPGAYLKQASPPYILLSHSQLVFSRAIVRLLILYQKAIALRATNAFKISLSLSFTPTLQSGSSPSFSFSIISRARLSRWVRPTRLRSHGLFIAEVHIGVDIQMFECTHLKFTVSGRSKQTNKHTHACAQRNHASVGFAQAFPQSSLPCLHTFCMPFLHLLRYIKAWLNLFLTTMCVIFLMLYLCT